MLTPTETERVWKILIQAKENMLLAVAKDEDAGLQTEILDRLEKSEPELVRLYYEINEKCVELQNRKIMYFQE